MRPDGYREKRVLVTGGAGFIGSHLVEALVQRGAHVCVIDDLSAGTLDNLDSCLHDIAFHALDVRSAPLADHFDRPFDILFHLAANASVPRSTDDPLDDFSRNALGTLNILEYARKRPVRSLVVASSGAVYGQPDRFPIEETEAVRPISPYGASKAAAEAVCHAFAASYHLPVKIARLFNTYGPRQPRFVMYDFYRKLRQNPHQLDILGSGQQIRDYCFVDDTVDALLRLGLFESSRCEAFNISSGHSYAIIELAQTMIAIMNLGRVELAFTGESWAGDAQRWEVSIAKIASAVGFRPRYDLRAGLERLVQWFDTHPQRIGVPN